MTSPLLRFSATLFIFAIGSAAGLAQPQQQAISAANRIDEARQVRLSGTVHPLARPENDRGAVADSFAAERMIAILSRPAERELALKKFLRDAHSIGLPGYHKWVTPEEFGATFGAPDEDIEQVKTWLQSHGFSVTRLTKSRSYLEFSGTAAQVREALHTEIHQYEVEGKSYFSIATEVSVPEAIAPLIHGFAPLNTFPLASYLRGGGRGTLSPASKRVSPGFTTTLGTKTIYPLAPEDFATQYNLGPLYQAGTDGAGKTIGIVGGANLDLSVVDAFRILYGLPGDTTQVVIDGEDPGIGFTPDVEGFLDVEVSGAIAPRATVNYYIGGGTHFQSGLVLATLRAIEDNQADVLSVSYGECEQLLGPNGNQLWAGFWEQAAAQGQTVLVSSGDSGPGTCPLGAGSVNGQLTYFGLSVNGLASSPWNIAVGGTDFYYSDFASGGASISTLWNAMNDAKYGSLKAPLPEQPWDDPLGLNIIPYNFTNFRVPSAAAGGGASNCSQFAAITNPPPPGPLPCAAGYAKPSWQNAPGVPADGARDLPDVSLFAANGANLTSYAICAEPGDCTPVTTGEPQVFLVGGTSASAPAMAGIMALLNQKYGRQGQANFTLYALARQQPSVFHDVTIGTNDDLCISAAPGCSTPVAGIPPVVTIGGGAVESWGVYNAGVGYDLASGLGSVDANALITNWNKISFLPTSTTLQISPASIVHGSPVNITTTVAASSGTVVPSGEVDISTTSPIPLIKGNELTLTDGTATASWSYFPGGTYSVKAQYAGDGTFGTSTSSVSTLAVTPEPSVTALSLRYEYFDYATTPLSGHGGTLANGGTAPFSSLWTLQAKPSGQTSLDTGDATGTAAFTDGSTTVTVPLNASGVATWSPQVLAVGSHSVTVNYSGDASYGESAAGPFTFTVSKGIPRVTAGLEALPALGSPTVPSSYLAGSTVVAHILLGALNSFVPPTGNVTVILGPLTQTVALTADAYSNQGLSAVNVTFANVPAGSFALTASYAGDSNWNAGSFSSLFPYVFANGTAIATTTKLSLTPSTVDSSGTVTFTATVTAASLVPIGFVNLFANGTSFSVINLNPPTVLGSSTTSGSVTVPATALPAGTLQVVAVYEGFTGITPSSSTPVPLTVNFTDFTLSTGAHQVAVKSGQSTTVSLLLGGPNGGSTNVTLACLPSTATFGCSISTPTPAVKGTMSETMTINAFIPQTGAATNLQTDGIRRGWLAASGGFAFGFVFVLAVPGRKRFGGLLACLALLAIVTFVAGCGGGSSGGPPPPPPPLNLNAPPGTYSVVVTGTSGGIRHNTKVVVVIQ